MSINSGGGGKDRVQNSISMGQIVPQLQRNQPKAIKIGVIGVGNMGQHHTRVLSLLKDVELVGVSDINVERGLDIASKYRVRSLLVLLKQNLW